VSADSTTQELVESVGAAVRERGGTLKLIPTPSFKDLFEASTMPDIVPLPKLDPDDVAVILHSSGQFHGSIHSACLLSYLPGSVTLPKVIKISFRCMKLFGLCLG
jgi:hypothetical protein